MNSLGRFMRIPGILRAFTPDTRPRNFHLHQSSCKDGKTIKGGDNGSDENMSKSINKNNHTTETQTTSPQKDQKTALTTSIENFQIYKTIPPEVDELFLKRNERFRYRHLNEMYKKEMNQIILKEKEMKTSQNGLDRSKVTPVAFKRNAIFDENLDNMVKSLLSETRSVITKLARQASPSTSRGKLTLPKTFEEVKDCIMMSKEKSNACSIPPGETTGNSSNISNSNGGDSGTGKGQNPPPTSPGDVIVSPYVDNKGNIDYTKAVVKSSGFDTAGADILKTLLQDPVKPLPTFEVPNVSRQSETILLRSDGTEGVISSGMSSHEPTLGTSSVETRKDTGVVRSDCSTKSPDEKVPDINRAKKPEATQTDGSVKKCTPRRKKVEKCKDKSKSKSSKPITPKVKSKTNCDGYPGFKPPAKVALPAKPGDCKKTPSIMRTQENPVPTGKPKSQCQQNVQPKHVDKDKCKGQAMKSKGQDTTSKGTSKDKVEKGKESGKPSIEPDGKCG